MRKRTKVFLILTIAVWGLSILIGLILSIKEGFKYENFGLFFVFLSAFLKEPIRSEEFNKLFFICWSFFWFLLLFLLVYIGLKKKVELLILIAFLITIVSVVVGLIRFVSALHFA